MRWQDLSIGSKGLVLVLVPLVLGLAALFTFAYLLNQADTETKLERKHRIITSAINVMGSDVIEAASTMSIYCFSRDPSLMARYNQIVNDAKQNYQLLLDMTRADPYEYQLVKQIGTVQQHDFDFIGKLKAIVDRRAEDLVLEQIPLVNQARLVMKDYGAQLIKLRDYEQAREDNSPTPKSAVWTERVETTIVIAAIANIAISLILAGLLSTSIRQRLSSLASNAKRLKNGETLLPRLDGKDEIAHLDYSFHAMASELNAVTRREQAIMNNALDVLCSLDAHWRFKAISAGATRLWGYLPDELIGKDLRSILSPQDLLQPLPTTGSAAEEAHSFENTVVSKSGKPVIMLWSARWSESEQGFFCVAHDITDRKLAENLLQQSEGKVRTIVESMPVALLIVGADGTITAANQTALNLFHYERGDLEGSPMRQLVPSFEARVSSAASGAMISATVNMIKTDTSFQNRARGGRLEAIEADGREVPVQISINDLHYQGARYFLVALLDMTQRREIELLKQQFVNILRNELREPISQIQTALDFVAAGNSISQRGNELVAKSRVETSRLLDLVNDLLDAERLESATIQLEVNNYQLQEIVDLSIQAVRSLADKSAIVLENLVAPTTICCDHARLTQVMVNLLSNAIKFSPPHSTVLIESKENEDSIELAVTDRGRGIPESHLATIFERFVQVERADSRPGRGTGLGLSICKTIVEQHGGTIGVKSETGKGSTFWLRVPKLTGSSDPGC